MSQQTESPKTFLSGEALARFRFVKFDAAGTVMYAAAADLGIGVTQQAVAITTGVAVRLVNTGGSLKVTAAAAFSAGDYLYHAADGKVSSTPAGPRIGVALEAATADGDLVEMFYQVSMLEWLGRTFVAVTATATVAVATWGQVIVVSNAAAAVLTFPASATVPGETWIVHQTPAVLLTIAAVATDGIIAPPGATGTATHTLKHTTATAKKGDFVCLDSGKVAHTLNLTRKTGIWALGAA